MAEMQRDTGDDSTTRSATRRPRRVPVRKILLALVLVPIVVIVAGLLLLQLDGVSTPLVNRLAARLSPWTESSLTVSSASLDGIGRVVLRGVRLARDDGTAMAWDPLESTCRHASLSIL